MRAISLQSPPPPIIVSIGYLGDKSGIWAATFLWWGVRLNNATHVAMGADPMARVADATGIRASSAGALPVCTPAQCPQPMAPRGGGCGTATCCSAGTGSSGSVTLRVLLNPQVSGVVQEEDHQSPWQGHEILRIFL